MKLRLLYYFRKMVGIVADEYLSQYKGRHDYEKIELVIHGFVKFLFDETAYPD